MNLGDHDPVDRRRVIVGAEAGHLLVSHDPDRADPLRARCHRHDEWISNEEGVGGRRCDAQRRRPLEEFPPRGRAQPRKTSSRSNTCLILVEFQFGQ